MSEKQRAENSDAQTHPPVHKVMAPNKDLNNDHVSNHLSRLLNTRVFKFSRTNSRTAYFHVNYKTERNESWGDLIGCNRVEHVDFALEEQRQLVRVGRQGRDWLRRKRLLG
jgi:hypothetical protein